MQLKRKRSESELSTSTTSTFNSPPRFGEFTSPCKYSMDMDNFPGSPLFHYGRNLVFAHAPGRTLKRLRDNRPSGPLVTERTLNILYAAQRQQVQPQSREPHLDPRQQNHNVPIAAQPAPTSSSSHQTSLHSFWNLPSRPSSSLPASNLPDSTETPTECEDCGQRFGGGDDVMMDGDDILGTSGANCGACGKHVCSNCSISNLGEQRRCLACAGNGVGNNTGGGRGTPWSRGISDWLC